MAYAYNRNIVPVVQDLMGGMIDFAVYGLDSSLADFYNAFLDSKYCIRVERADSKTVMGRSGIELCYDILGRESIDSDAMNAYTAHAISQRSQEYWTGWAVAYYQWLTSLAYREINEVRDINDIAAMYSVYHEMDISHFSDRMSEIYRQKHPDSKLKTMRMNAGLTQRELAMATEIPLKTIQQYEQRRKNINSDSVDYLVTLSRTLNCDIEMLIEKV